MGDCCGPFKRGKPAKATNPKQQCFADCCGNLCPPDNCCSSVNVYFECGCKCDCEFNGYNFTGLRFKRKKKVPKAPLIPSFTRNTLSANGFTFAASGTIPSVPSSSSSARYGAWCKDGVCKEGTYEDYLLDQMMGMAPASLFDGFNENQTCYTIVCRTQKCVWEFTMEYNCSDATWGIIHSGTTCEENPSNIGVWIQSDENPCVFTRRELSENKCETSDQCQQPNPEQFPADIPDYPPAECCDRCVWRFASRYDCDKKKWSDPWHLNTVCENPATGLGTWKPDPEDKCLYIFKKLSPQRCDPEVGDEDCETPPPQQSYPDPPEIEPPPNCCWVCVWEFSRTYDCKNAKWGDVDAQVNKKCETLPLAKINQWFQDPKNDCKFLLRKQAKDAEGKDIKCEDFNQDEKINASDSEGCPDPANADKPIDEPAKIPEKCCNQCVWTFEAEFDCDSGWTVSLSQKSCEKNPKNLNFWIDSLPCIKEYRKLAGRTCVEEDDCSEEEPKATDEPKPPFWPFEFTPPGCCSVPPEPVPYLCASNDVTGEYGCISYDEFDDSIHTMTGGPYETLEECQQKCEPQFYCVRDKQNICEGGGCKGWYISSPEACSFTNSAAAGTTVYASQDDCLCGGLGISAACERLGAQAVLEPYCLEGYLVDSSKHDVLGGPYDSIEECQQKCPPTSSSSSSSLPCECRQIEVNLSTSGCCLYLAAGGIEAVGDGTVAASYSGPGLPNCEVGVLLNGSLDSATVKDGDPIGIEIQVVGDCKCCETQRDCNSQAAAMWVQKSSRDRSTMVLNKEALMKKVRFAAERVRGRRKS